MRRREDFQVAIVTLGRWLAEVGQMREDLGWRQADCPAQSVTFDGERATMDVNAKPWRFEGADLGLGDDPAKLGRAEE
jgi:hypothetical protein